MDNMIKKLEELHQLDCDAVKAYQEAIDKIENPQIKTRLREFKEDHQSHLENLEALIVSRGGSKPDRKLDAKGYLIEGMTKMRSSMSDEQALKAMKQNEVITNKKYSDVLKEVRGDTEIMSVVNGNYNDERKHLDYITNALSVAERVDESHPGM